MPIEIVIKKKRVENVFMERDLLRKLSDNVFFAKLYKTERNERYIYFWLEFVVCGPLETLIKNNRRSQQMFDHKTIVFYASEILCALEFINELGLVLVDLRPKNVMITPHGHVKLVGLSDACLAGRTLPISSIKSLLDESSYVAPQVPYYFFKAIIFNI